MPRFLIVWFATAVGLAVVAHLGIGIGTRNLLVAGEAGLVLGLVNTFVRPVVKLLTLPLNLITLGLFGLVVNALMLWLVSALVPGFSVAGFGAAFWGALILSLIAGVIQWVV